MRCAAAPRSDGGVVHERWLPWSGRPSYNTATSHGGDGVVGGAQCMVYDVWCMVYGGWCGYGYGRECECGILCHFEKMSRHEQRRADRTRALGGLEPPRPRAVSVAASVAVNVAVFASTAAGRTAAGMKGTDRPARGNSVHARAGFVFFSLFASQKRRREQKAPRAQAGGAERSSRRWGVRRRVAREQQAARCTAG